MVRLLKILWKTVKWCFIVFLVYAGSLLFREERVPVKRFSSLVDDYIPSNLMVRASAITYGWRTGVAVEGLRVYNRLENPQVPMISVERLEYNPITHHLQIDGLRYPRLPESYYLPGNHERNAPVEVELPELERIDFTMIRSEVLGVTPEKLTGRLEIHDNRLVADELRLFWPDRDVHMHLNGFCFVDIPKQEIYGEVEGEARQPNIRPLLVALDIPSSYPYFDAFTEFTAPVPSWCSWKVNLVNNDFDLGLKLHPRNGRYQSVPVKAADGELWLHVYTRDEHLNYRHTIGPISAVGHKGEPLQGTVRVSGTNGYNTVEVDATSAMAVADVLKIGGFTGDYVGSDVIGQSKGKLQFRFPRAMTNNYEVLNGEGHVELEGGRLMRMKGFKGLIEQLADKVPGISWFTDVTRCSGDYRIVNGIVKSDNLYIEGSAFSIKMVGEFDTLRSQLNYTVRVQFAKNDSLAGKLLHPLTWPFTKLLLEFKLTGSPEKPVWTYISVLDRVLEAAE